MTALYGSVDALKPAMPQNGIDVDWVLVTDDATLRGSALGWRVVYMPRPGLHPNRAAKIPKLFPWEYTQAPASVWLDASFRVVSPEFVKGALSFADPIAQFRHPWRDCVYQEADAGARLAKYAGEDFAAQKATYRVAMRHPENWGLWATGVIARQHENVQVHDMSEHWSELIGAGTFQDQVSEPVALRHNGLRPTEFPGTHFANPWVRYEGKRP